MSTSVGYVNRNNQKNLGKTQGQLLYELECQDCFHRYQVNGYDIFQRKCPNCQNGRRPQNKEKDNIDENEKKLSNHNSNSKAKVISSMNEVIELRADIIKSAEIAKDNISKILNNSTAIDVLYDLKFRKVGYEPLKGVPINIIEQLNQTFTYLVSLEAVLYLLELYPSQSFLLNMGTTSGHDIVSKDKSIIGEVFAATSPMSNNKLEEDMIKLHLNNDAVLKYSFYYSYTDNLKQVENLKLKYSDVNVVKVFLDSIRK